MPGFEKNKMNEYVPSGYKKVLFPILLTLLCLVLLVLVYGGSVVWRGLGMYWDVKTSGQGYIGNLYNVDSLLGYVPAPNVDGFNAIPLGAPVATHHDDEGLVAPMGIKHVFVGDKHPRLLFLGDSFTYGQMVAAEDSYPYKSARKLHGEAVNGAVPGYGLVQMVLRAQQLIPKYRPDYVIVQYSPWLVVRAVTPLAPTYNQLVVPVPYYAGDDAPRIVEPAFTPVGLSLDRYRTSVSGLDDKLSFLWRVALPKYLYEDVQLNLFRLEQLVSVAAAPSHNGEEVIRRSYAQIDDIARQNEAKMLIFVLGNNVPLTIPDGLFPSDAEVVNGQQALIDRLPAADSRNYMLYYWHWRGNPPRPVDWHPNQWAHEILAQTLAQRIAELPTTRH